MRFSKRPAAPRNSQGADRGRGPAPMDRLNTAGCGPRCQRRAAGYSTCLRLLVTLSDMPGSTGPLTIVHREDC